MKVWDSSDNRDSKWIGCIAIFSDETVFLCFVLPVQVLKLCSTDRVGWMLIRIECINNEFLSTMLSYLVRN